MEKNWLYGTINDKSQIRTLIKAGVDGLVTDRPDVVKKVIEDMIKKENWTLKDVPK